MDYLGFTIDSVHMSITLPPNKGTDLTEACKTLTGIREPSILQVARVIEKLVAAFQQHNLDHSINKTCKEQKF